MKATARVKDYTRAIHDIYIYIHTIRAMLRGEIVIKNKTPPLGTCMGGDLIEQKHGSGP